MQHKFTLEDTVHLEDSWLLYPFYLEKCVSLLFLYPDLIVIAYDPVVISSPLRFRNKGTTTEIQA